MIDTDKYEGHFDGVWTLHPDIDYNCELRIDDAVIACTHTDEPTTQLIADAPLLLEELKRLREGIVNALIPTEAKPIIHPLVKLGDLRKALKELIE